MAFHCVEKGEMIPGPTLHRCRWRSAMGIQTVTWPILAHVYSVQQGRCWVEIPTLDNGNERDPMCTHALDGPQTQPYEHNCKLQIIHGKTKQHISNLLQESHTLEGEWDHQGHCWRRVSLAWINRRHESRKRREEMGREYVGASGRSTSRLCTGSVSRRFAVEYTGMCSPHFVDLSSTSSKENGFPSPKHLVFHMP